MAMVFLTFRLAGLTSVFRRALSIRGRKAASSKQCRMPWE